MGSRARFAGLVAMARALVSSPLCFSSSPCLTAWASLGSFEADSRRIDRRVSLSHPLEVATLPHFNSFCFLCCLATSTAESSMDSVQLAGCLSRNYDLIFSLEFRHLPPYPAIDCYNQAPFRLCRSATFSVIACCFRGHTTAPTPSQS